MKKLPLWLLALISLFALSCSSDDSSPVTPEPEIIDDYKLLSVTSEGKIFEIGNNSGETHSIGQITNRANLIMLPTICNIGSKIYALEASYVPAPNILIVYDKSNGTTSTQQLILPASVASTMTDPFITNLEYNGSEFIAIVSENMPNDSRPNKIISINPQNFQTTDLNISFFQRTLSSTELIGNKLYISTRTEGLLEVDLSLKTVTELQSGSVQINGTRLVKVSNTKLGLMRFNVPQVINGVKPFEFDLSNNTLSDKSVGNIFAVGNVTGGTVFYNSEFLNIVYNENSKFGILKINYTNNEREFIELNPDILGSNAIIVDIIE